MFSSWGLLSLPLWQAMEEDDTRETVPSSAHTTSTLIHGWKEKLFLLYK